MSRKKHHPPRPPLPDDSLSTGKLPEQTVEEVHVIYEPSPPPAPRNQRIHPRQVIPPVPEGEPRPDETPSPPVELE